MELEFGSGNSKPFQKILAGSLVARSRQQGKFYELSVIKAPIFCGAAEDF